MTFWWFSTKSRHGSVPTHTSSCTCAVGAAEKSSWPKERPKDKCFPWNMRGTLWIQAVLCLLIRNVSISDIPERSESTTSSSVRTISRAISFGVINYFSLLSEQMSLRWAELILSRDWKKKCSLEGWNADLSLLQASFFLVNKAKII